MSDTQTDACPCRNSCCKTPDVYRWPDKYCECRECGEACDCLMEGVTR